MLHAEKTRELAVRPPPREPRCWVLAERQAPNAESLISP